MTANRLLPYGRVLVGCAAVQFVVSFAILLLASTNDISQYPAPVGFVDVALVATLVVTLVLIKTAIGWENDGRATRVSYASITYLVPILIAAIWFFREQLILNTLLPGLAWRMFVLLEMLPSALTILFKPQA